MTIARTDKAEIADEMLDAAIEQFFEGRYFAALNLSGVAQEIYGKLVRLAGLQDQIQETIHFANEIAKLQGGPEVTVKEWKKIAGEQKNGIKHFDSETDRYIDMDAQDEARSMIGDAVSEKDKLGRANTKNTDRFYEFARVWSVKNVHIRES
ncbi:hypothetical protein [Zhongshania sp.]|jgi:hypothetical protein|uniref:hypothetical protein n=1 Tax=Zhongshania sp. TaxID=1971902 RepID=UPI003565609C